MVVTDVWEEVFNKRVITDTCSYESTFKDSGLKLCNSMKDGREIYRIHFCVNWFLVSWKFS